MPKLPAAVLQNLGYLREDCPSDGRTRLADSPGSEWCSGCALFPTKESYLTESKSLSIVSNSVHLQIVFQVRLTDIHRTARTCFESSSGAFVLPPLRLLFIYSDDTGTWADKLWSEWDTGTNSLQGRRHTWTQTWIQIAWRNGNFLKPRPTRESVCHLFDYFCHIPASNLHFISETRLCPPQWEFGQDSNSQWLLPMLPRGSFPGLYRGITYPSSCAQSLDYKITLGRIVNNIGFSP